MESPAERRLSGLVRIKEMVIPRSGDPWAEAFVTKNNGNGWKVGQEVRVVVEGVVKTTDPDGAFAELKVKSVTPLP